MNLLTVTRINDRKKISPYERRICMVKKFSRRDFLKRSSTLGVSAVLGGAALPHMFKGSLFTLDNEPLDITVVKGQDYAANTYKAVELLGGIEKFVPKGAKVALLPNTQSRHPGTFTKPDILRAVIQMCKKAGAKEVNCLSWLRQKHWDSTGLSKAVEEEGANLKLIDMKDETQYKAVPLANGKILKEAKIFNDLFDSDVFIDMPITKDHAGNRFTGTLKNYMGLNFQAINGTFHTGDRRREISDDIEHLDQCIADLNLALKPTLCIVDGTELITTNGPFGPGELIKPMKVIAGTDRVAIDSYCTTLWGMKGTDIIMIKKAFEHGIGEIDLNKVKIKEVSI